MKIRKSGIMAACALGCLMFPQPQAVYASDGEGYITISVEATDDNGNLKYALDTDDEDAFTDKNEFTIPEGTSHTIYVKDAAGNVTSQSYNPDKETSEEYPEITARTTPTEDGQRIDIDLEIGAGDEIDYSGYEYLTDDPVEPGAGTMAEKIRTDGSDSDDAERIFYTFTTKEGEVLYLVIDQRQSSDNVYLLDTVSVGDLLALADGSGKASAEKEEDNLLSILSKEADSDTADIDADKKNEKSSGSNILIYIVLAAAGGGIYYYFKIYKNKKDEAMDVVDAMDMEDFEAEEDDEEIDFEDFNDEEKEKYLEDLINEEEELYDTDPEEYATSHMETEDSFGEESAEMEEKSDFDNLFDEEEGF